MSSGIQDFLRVRPFTKRELEEDAAAPVVELSSDARCIVLFDPSQPDVERGTFSFDFCISPFRSGVQMDGDSDDEDEEDRAEVAQEECYALAGAPILTASWAGFNGCVFAYGQTNSGKTDSRGCAVSCSSASRSRWRPSASRGKKSPPPCP